MFVAVLACSVAVLGSLAAAAPAAQAGAQIVTRKGVDGLRLGAGVRALHRRHLIGRLRPGCELDPGQRVAPLRPPLRGFAVFHRKRLTSLSITAGAETAAGIGIGSTPHQARTAYPNGEYFAPGQADPFEQGFFWVNDTAHPKFTFTVDADSHLIVEISVPAPNFCE